jgi:hypothetical protein
MERDKSQMELVGIEDTLGIFSDVFLIAREDETGISNIYFLQSNISITEPSEGTITGARPAKKAKCVARLMFSEKGFDTLLGALAENRGFTLTPRVAEQK